MTERGILELPIAQIAALFYNANRDPGDEEKGRSPAEPKSVEDFQIFGKRKNRTKTLAAKDEARPGGRHVHDGAKADKSAWTAWARGKTKQQVRVIRKPRG